MVYITIGATVTGNANTINFCCKVLYKYDKVEMQENIQKDWNSKTF